MRSKIYGIICCFAMLIIPFIIMSIDDHVEHSQSLCPFKMLTGFPCPGCGITKSIIFFYEGDIWKSLSFHIFGPFVVIFSIIIVILLLCEIITKKNILRPVFYSKRIALILAVLLTCFHLYRTVIFVRDHSLHQILQESIWL